ncbi:MAG TPA: c-type cytochrome [Chitinophagaceae bacterium]|jgi:mono/diheme cytochrome c family protein
MKKFFRVTFAVIAALLILVSAVAAYVSFALPDIGDAPDIKVKLTPQRIERGRYLVNSVAACMVCHAQRNFALFAGPVDSATFGAGGEKFTREMDFPGNLYTKNITPYALQSWTDGEVFRAITAGVSKDGAALFPLMPYDHYAQMDKEDVYSMIAYLRTLRPIKSKIPERELDFPLNFIVNTIPVKAALITKVDSFNTIEYGKYLVNAASCMQCHTKEVKGDIIAGSEFSGGHQFMMPAGTVYSPNITPDKETGIGGWTREAFIRRFKFYADTSYHPVKLKPTDFNTPMPWITYSTMTEKDLGAIYDYLQTIKPIKNKVEIFLKK